MSIPADAGLVGHMVTEVRPMTPTETAQYAWQGMGTTGLVIVLDNGTRLIPSQDPEGNGPGALFGEDDEGKFMLHFR